MRIRATTAGLITLGVSAALGLAAAPPAAADPVPVHCAWGRMVAPGVWEHRPIAFGDVNRDLEVTSYDAYLASTLIPSLSEYSCADVDLSGTVTTRDVHLIQQAVVGLVTLPVPLDT